MIFPALLLSGAVPDLSISTLLDANHEHEWVLLEQSGSFWFHWDRNSIQRVEFEEGAFPIVLIRHQTVPAQYPSGRSDVVIAIDCHRNMTATVEASHEIAEEAFSAGENRWKIDHLEFGAFAERDMDRRETQAMMIEVCGANWSR